jgi:cellulose synthase/poly-beta-1,6-N-acetylglucosamine synthase-like glycosyltransferase
MIESALVVAYLAASLVLTLHAVMQLLLAAAARRARVAPTPLGPLPSVTLQLPVYNEPRVVVRLLEHVARLRYPDGLLQVQVLDDSTDETTALVEQALKRLGLRNVAHIRRASRDGYKAGALDHGLALVTTDAVAVLDADFMPDPDFLLRLAPSLAGNGIAAVQARWAHANPDHSPLTRLQALQLDAHFGVEQAGRQALGAYINFNGTAGIWRVMVVRAAGGWSAATLTEDLDLSYRVQLAGWRILYLDDVTVSAELPARVGAFRIQQYRWMKGVTQNAVRLLPQVLRAALPMRVKAHAAAHLLDPVNFLAMLVVIVLTPLMGVLAVDGRVPALLVGNPLWIINIAILGSVYAQPQRPAGAAAWASFLVTWIAFVAVSAGMAVHNAVAVLDGFSGRVSPFYRTPKEGDAGDVPGELLGPPRIRGVVAAEAVVTVYLVATLLVVAAKGGLLLMWIPLAALAGLAALAVGSLIDVYRRSPVNVARLTGKP